MTARAALRSIGYLAADTAHFMLETVWPSESRHHALELHRAEITRQALVEREAAEDVSEPAPGGCDCGLSDDPDDLDQHGFACSIWDQEDFSAVGADAESSPDGVSDPPTPPPSGHSTSGLLIAAAHQLAACRAEHLVSNARDEYLAEHLIPDLRARAELFVAMGD